jgi:hypothetical protein
MPWRDATTGLAIHNIFYDTKSHILHIGKSLDRRRNENSPFPSDTDCCGQAREIGKTDIAQIA